MSKNKPNANSLPVPPEIGKDGETDIVNQRGRSALSIQPFNDKRTVEEVFADVRDAPIYHEDIDAPTMDEWDDP